MTDLRLQEWISSEEFRQDGWVVAEQELVSPTTPDAAQSALWRWSGKSGSWHINWWQGLSGLGVSDLLCQLGITPQPMQLSAVLGLGRHH